MKPVPMRVFETHLASIQRLSPTFVRLTLAGESLKQLHRCGDLGPRDLRVKLLLAIDGSGPAPVLPDFDLPSGYAAWRGLDPSERGVMRTYTIRRIHGTEREPAVDLDVVLHPGGPAATWAEQARLGDPAAFVGPDRASEWYGGIEWRPPTALGTRVLLVGDETAVPAIGSILETLPSEYVGDVLVEVPTKQDFLALSTKADVHVRFLARGERPRGQLLLTLLQKLMRATAAEVPLEDLDVDNELLWEVPERRTEGFYAWVAGEAAMVRDVRRHLVHECGLDRRGVAFMGYWREGRPEKG